MKSDKYQRYIYWGVTAFIVLALLVVFVFTIKEMEKVKAGFRMLFHILAPITYGAVLAWWSLLQEAAKCPGRDGRHWDAFWQLLSV